MENDWTKDVETVLENIRQNAAILSREHKHRYFTLRENLKYYRLPVIVLSGINSIFSVGLQPYMDQSGISMLTCLLALICSVIGSIELYLAIQKTMESELISQRDFYLLSVDIFKTLSLQRKHRPIPAKDYLEKCYNTYCKLIENSQAITKRLEDSLCPLPLPNESTLELARVSSSGNLEVSEIQNNEERV